MITFLRLMIIGAKFLPTILFALITHQQRK